MRKFEEKKRKMDERKRKRQKKDKLAVMRVFFLSLLYPFFDLLRKVKLHLILGVREYNTDLM